MKWFAERSSSTPAFSCLHFTRPLLVTLLCCRLKVRVVSHVRSRGHTQWLHNRKSCLRTGDETKRRKERKRESKENLSPHSGGKWWEEKWWTTQTCLLLWASSPGQQVVIKIKQNKAKKKRNLTFFLLSSWYNYISHQVLLNLPIGSYCLWHC